MPGSSPPEEGERLFNENKKVEKKKQMRLEGKTTRCGKTVTSRQRLKNVARVNMNQRKEHENESTLETAKKQ